jgi:methylated-DNA-[protein]-cysteine S-methyltransferase
MFGVFTQLEEYFNKKRKTFNVPLWLEGTAFQKNVWSKLQKIPFGKTISYKTLAERVGNIKSVRAVGGANSANPVPVIIPCHRVINADGTIGGYSAGLDIKLKLLQLEGSFNPDLFE